MENVDAVLRIYAGSDVAETPGPDEFVAADYYVFGLDGLDWGGVWGDEEGVVSFCFAFILFLVVWKGEGESQELTGDALEIGFLVWCRDAFDAELFLFR